MTRRAGVDMCDGIDRITIRALDTSARDAQSIDADGDAHLGNEDAGGHDLEDSEDDGSLLDAESDSSGASLDEAAPAMHMHVSMQSRPPPRGSTKSTAATYHSRDAETRPTRTSSRRPRMQQAPALDVARVTRAQVEGHPACATCEFREHSHSTGDGKEGPVAAFAPIPAFASDVQRPVSLSSNDLAELRTAVAQQRAASLFSRRKYWYKPVALISGQAYSITEGEAIAFVMGKRMLTSNEGLNSRARRKTGFLVYDCASRALQAALYKPRGRLATANKAVLRVTATRPCTPSEYEWPTEGGVWAFEVIVPVSIALEQQTWMEDKTLASMWLPASPPGHCRQCALGERVCIQIRNHLEMGEPPLSSRKPWSTSSGSSAIWERSVVRSCSASGSQQQQADEAEWSLLPGEPPGLDHRSFI